MQQTHLVYSKPIAPEDSRGSLTRATVECTRLSLEKWRVKEGWMLCRIDGLQCSTNCPEIKWGSTAGGFHAPASSFIRCTWNLKPPWISLSSQWGYWRLSL